MKYDIRGIYATPGRDGCYTAVVVERPTLWGKDTLHEYSSYPATFTYGGNAWYRKDGTQAPKKLRLLLDGAWKARLYSGEYA